MPYALYRSASASPRCRTCAKNSSGNVRALVSVGAMSVTSVTRRFPTGPLRCSPSPPLPVEPPAPRRGALGDAQPQVRLADVLVLFQVLRGALEHHPTGLQDGGLVGHPEGQASVLLDEQDRG